MPRIYLVLEYSCILNLVVILNLEFECGDAYA
jgi:hypothetical protein